MLEWVFSEPLPTGSQAPDFSLPDQEGKLISLRDLRGRNVLLLFYPGDHTPTCTAQLCEFRDSWERLEGARTSVYGINPQTAASHARFREKQRLPFPLLVDKGQKVAELYRANGLFVKRTVYVIGPDGRIRLSRRGKPSIEELLSATLR